VAPGDPDLAGYYVFTAAPGEINAVTVVEEPNGLRVTDTGAPIAGCPAAAPDSVLCPLRTNIFVEAGDGDDTVSGDHGLLSAGGGPGNDRLVGTSPTVAFLSGGEGDDVLVGGPGDDILDGGPGADRVSGGTGRDLLHTGNDGTAPAPDILDGGDGEDRVSYQRRQRAVRVDLAARGGGEPGENDTYVSIENAAGGDAADVLLGDDGPNTLDAEFQGERGDATGDRIDGRGGDDFIDGGTGDDTLLGGAGDDTIEGDGGADHYDGGPGEDRLWLELAKAPDVRCGAGEDTAFVFNAGGALLHSDCERVEAEAALLRIDRSRHAIRLRVRWNARDYKRPCRIAVAGATVRRPSSTRSRTVSLSRRARLVTVRPSARCEGPIGMGYTRTAFRLTS
jgi:Ca2+-binding RTX toxin-like protein